MSDPLDGANQASHVFWPNEIAFCQPGASNLRTIVSY